MKTKWRLKKTNGCWQLTRIFPFFVPEGIFTVGFTNFDAAIKELKWQIEGRWQQIVKP